MQCVYQSKIVIDSIPEIGSFENLNKGEKKHTILPYIQYTLPHITKDCILVASTHDDSWCVCVALLLINTVFGSYFGRGVYVSSCSTAARRCIQALTTIFCRRSCCLCPNSHSHSYLFLKGIIPPLVFRLAKSEISDIHQPFQGCSKLLFRSCGATAGV